MNTTYRLTDGFKLLFLITSVIALACGLVYFEPNIPVPLVHAQPLPNCFMAGTFTSTGTTAATGSNLIDNSANGNQCNSWVLTVFASTGISGFSITLQGSGAGTFSATTVTVLSGTNPCTTLTGCVSTNQTAFNQYRLNLTSLTGTGTITYRLQGASGITARLPLGPTGAAGGDLSGTYPNPTVANVNATSFPTNAAADQTPITTASAVAAWKSFPGCLDSGGNHLNYDTTAHSILCGTSSAAATAPAKQFASTQIVTVSGTASATTLLGTGAGTLTLPVNFFANAGDILHIQANLTQDANAVAGSADAYNIKLGSTTLATGTAGTAPTATAGSNSCALDAIFQAVTVGSSGTIMGNGVLVCRVVGASDAARVTVISNGGGPTATTTINTTTTQVLDFQVAQGSTSHITKQVGFLVTNY